MNENEKEKGIAPEKTVIIVTPSQKQQWKHGTDGFEEEFECIFGNNGRSPKQGSKI